MDYKLTKVYTNDIWHEYVWEISCCILNRKHITPVISMLNNFFPLHTRMKIIMSSYPMCYAKCGNIFALKTITYVDE